MHSVTLLITDIDLADDIALITEDVAQA